MNYKKSKIIKIAIYLLFLTAYTNVHSQNITVGGIFNENTEWIVDTVTIISDVYILDGIKLTIYPGAFVKIAGAYEIIVHGCIEALGTYSAPIIFSVIDKSEFTNTNTTKGGWQGFRFNKIQTSNDTSKFINCEFSYAKAVGNSSFDRNGGVFYINEVSKLFVSNCRFINNLAIESGGAIYCENQSSPIITNNYFNNNVAYNNGGSLCLMLQSSSMIIGNTISYNTAGFDGGGVYIANSKNKAGLIGNLIVNNVAINGGGVYEGNPYYSIQNNIICNNQAGVGGGIYNGISESTAKYINNTIANNFAKRGGGILCNSNSLSLINNIIYGNVAEFADTLSQIAVSLGEPIVSYCDIEGGYKGEGNIDEFPYFRNSTEGAGNKFDATNSDWSIQDYPCADVGIPDTSGLNLPKFDFIGNERIAEGYRIDMGAIEFEGYHATEIKNNKLHENFSINPNPITGVCNIEISDNLSFINGQVYNIFGVKVLEILDVNSKNFNIDLSALLDGFYFISMRIENQIIVKKIIKQK